MKKFLWSMVSVLAVLFFLPISSEATTQVSIHFRDIEELNLKEQESIVREKPLVSQAFNEYYIVYQKIDKFTQNSTHASEQPVSSDKKQTVAAQPNQNRLYPKTGDKENRLFYLSGAMIVVFAIIILYRRKKYANLFLIMIIPVAIGSGGHNMTALATEMAIADTESLTIIEGGQQTIEPKNIQGYTYVGYYKAGEQPAVVEASLKVLYVNENQQEIHKPQIVVGNIGDNYDVSGDQYKLSIDGYSLNETKLPTNAIGVFEVSDQTVIYEYTQKSIALEQGKVVVQYLNMDGVEIAASETMTGNIGETFHAKQKEISKMLLDHVSGQIDGKFSKDETLIQFFYTDEVKINVHYIDKVTKQPLVLDAFKPYLDHLRPNINDIDGYYFTNSYSGEIYSQESIPTTKQITVKVGSTYNLPREIRMLITKPDGTTMSVFNFPTSFNNNGMSIDGFESYSNFLYGIEQPGDVPTNSSGVADQIEIDVIYELSYTAISWD